MVFFSLQKVKVSKIPTLKIRYEFVVLVHLISPSVSVARFDLKKFQIFLFLLNNQSDFNFLALKALQKKKMTNALSFYVTKTVLVGPKWFWSDQIDLDLTIMIWSRPK